MHASSSGYLGSGDVLGGVRGGVRGGALGAVCGGGALVDVCGVVLSSLLGCAVLVFSAGCDTPGSSNSGSLPADVVAAAEINVADTGSDTAVDTAAPDAAAETSPTDTAPASDGGDEVSAGVCPPAGPFGTTVGSTLADVTVYDCDGNAKALSSLCSNDASLVVTFAGWCSACRSYAESLANTVHNNVQGQGTSGGFAVDTALVITEKPNGSEPDADYCVQIRDEYQLEMPVYYDPTDAMETAWGVTSNSQEVVVGRGMTLFWKNKGGGWAHPDSVVQVKALLDSL